MATGFPWLRLAERFDARHKGIAGTIGRMAELKLRLSILHPETCDAEVVIGFRQIGAKHEALPNLP